MVVEESRRGTIEENRRSTMTVQEGTNNALEEYRRIRVMQDEEYEEMLRADQDKVCV